MTARHATMDVSYDTSNDVTSSLKINADKAFALKYDSIPLCGASYVDDKLTNLVLQSAWLRYFC